jgi:hypothetical protein
VEDALDLVYTDEDISSIDNYRGMTRIYKDEKPYSEFKEADDMTNVSMYIEIIKELFYRLVSFKTKKTITTTQFEKLS